MATTSGLKQVMCSSLVLGGIDTLFRFINRGKLLVVMYHGVTRNTYDPPVWTQLPQAVFRDQLQFLKKQYTIISIEQLLDAIRGRTNLPPRAALLTFDDGLMNNYSVAFPLLKELDTPATIFLTSDFIGTTNIFWFDELYLLLKQLYQQGRTLSDTALALQVDLPLLPEGEFPYYRMVNWMKFLSAARRTELLHHLRQLIPLDRAGYREDFCSLGWDEIKVMLASGLVEFGVHTATHQILTDLDEPGLQREAIDSRTMIEEHLGRPVRSFCYPNGQPGVDFTREHENFLAEHGFLCAFSTRIGLSCCGKENFALRRIPVGNDGTSEPDYFRLNTAGAFDIARTCGLATV